jgi:hypothetical protein
MAVTAADRYATSDSSRRCGQPPVPPPEGGGSAAAPAAHTGSHDGGTTAPSRRATAGVLRPPGRTPPRHRGTVWAGVGRCGPVWAGVGAHLGASVTAPVRQRSPPAYAGCAQRLIPTAHTARTRRRTPNAAARPMTCTVSQAQARGHGGISAGWVGLPGGRRARREVATSPDSRLWVRVGPHTHRVGLTRRLCWVRPPVCRTGARVYGRRMVRPRTVAAEPELHAQKTCYRELLVGSDGYRSESGR